MTFLGKDLRPVSSARDLGVEFDECLSFDEHDYRGGLKVYKVSLSDQSNKHARLRKILSSYSPCRAVLPHELLVARESMIISHPFYNN